MTKESATRKIGEPAVYRDHIDVIYPGEQARIKITMSDEGPPETVFFVDPIPGTRGVVLRLRYRLWGRWWGGPASVRVRVGDSWDDREEDD